MSAATLSPDFWHRIEQALAQLKPARLTVAAVSRAGTPDRARHWIPQPLSPLSDSAAYAALPPAQQRRYNQLYALQVTEQFIWLERELVIRPAQRLLGEGTLLLETGSISIQSEGHPVEFRRIDVLPLAKAKDAGGH